MFNMDVVVNGASAWQNYMHGNMAIWRWVAWVRMAAEDADGGLG